MNIGEFQLRNGRLMGSIATRTIDLPHLGLRPVESQNDRAPIYEIVALNVGNRWVQIGALWEAVARNSTGEAFLQGSSGNEGDESGRRAGPRRRLCRLTRPSR